MVGVERCEQCGGALGGGVLGGRCPRCLVELAIDPTTGRSAGNTPANQLRLGDSLLSGAIGRYKLLRLIGEGGMGTVYEAEQENPRRTVALKIIKAGMADADSLRRFAQECQALGRLQHPGIAQIYEAGTADTGFGPQPYFAMELIRGVTPRDYVRDRQPDARQRLELVARIADAVHHAHQRGLIHRDLKPSNILVDESGQPKVLDFGVTRVTDDGGQATRQTVLGELVGTLSYMSPEQVSGDPLEIDTRTDVYALGVLLHELLAGRLPYDTRRPLPDVIRAIQEEEPVRLGTIDRKYKGDIETIAIRALEKNKTRRYASAAELAADIRRHLNDEPIIARPPSARYQLQKFSRRNRGLVAGVAAVFAVLVLGFVASAWQAARALRAERAAVQERDRALQAETQARAERDRAAAAEQQANDQRDRARVAEEQATLNATRATIAQREAIVAQRRADAVAAITREQRLLNLSRSLSRESVRDSSNQLDGDRAALLARQALLFHALTPGEPRYLVEEALQQAAAIDRWSHTLPLGARTVAFSRNGFYIASGGIDPIVRVWDLRKPGAPLHTLKGHRQPVAAVAFSPDGSRLASASDGIRVWDLRRPDAEPVLLSDGTASVASIAFSPDGARLASAGDVVRIWDLHNPAARPFSLPAGVAAPGSSPFSPVVKSVVFSADGVHLAAAGDGVRVWKLVDVNARPLVLWESQATAVAFSPDGTRLAAGGLATSGARLPGSEAGETVLIWNLRDPSETPLPFGGNPYGLVTSVAFSDDGARLAAGGLDGSLRLWDVRNPDAAPLLLRGQRSVNSIAFSPNGSSVASASFESVWLWDVKGAAIPRPVLPRITDETLAALSNDGRRVVSVRGRMTMRVWNLAAPDAKPFAIDNAVLGPFSVFSADGRQLASADVKSVIRVWNLDQPASAPVLLEGHQGPIMSLAFSPDGSRLASGGLDRSIRIWDVAAGASPVVIRVDGPQGFRALTFSADGSKLAFTSIDRLYLTDLGTSDPAPVLLTRVQASTIPTALAFTPDGSRLATAGGVSQTVLLFDLRNPDAAPLLLEGGHKGSVRAVAFSPDGARLASTSEDRTVRLWDLRRSEALPLVFTVPDGPANAVVFSRDSTRLLAMTRTTVLEWPLWSAAADYLCTRVWRNLSLNEWRLYVGEGVPYQRTCPALPAGDGVSE